MKIQYRLLIMLAVLMLLFTGCQQNTLKPNTDGVYELNTAQDLEFMTQHPDKSYILMQDIDLQGCQWTPVTAFSGTFDGNGKTISNASISLPAEGSTELGFFARITAEGTVTELHLKDIRVDALKSGCRNIGTFAGILEGKLLSCTATGTIQDNRQNCDGQEICVGAIAGKAGSSAVLQGGTTLSVTDNAGVYTTEGLAADVKLFVSDSTQVLRGLIGQADSGSQVTGLWRDRFYSSERLSQTMQERQRIVEEYMYQMGTVQWTTPKKLTYVPSSGPNNLHAQTFEPGQTYSGLPYNQLNGSMERFVYCLDENNQVLDWVISEKGNGVYGPEGYEGFIQYMGNDCSSAVSWAWLQVSPIVAELDGKDQGGSYAYYTEYMVPNITHREQYGIYPVGNWQTYEPALGAYQVDNETLTAVVIFKNTKETMLEAYAQTRKADALLCYAMNGGHSRLVAEDPVVIRNADGTIDPTISYFLTHEQGDGLLDRRHLGTNSSWRVNHRYTFATLMDGSTLEDETQRQLEKGSGLAYIPITIPAMRNETVAESVLLTYPAADMRQITGPFSGSYCSNYRIVSTLLTVRDSAGNTVLETEVFTGVSSYGSVFRGRNNIVNLEELPADTLQDLAPGSYTVTLAAKLSSDTIMTVVENIPYTHS